MKKNLLKTGLFLLLFFSILLSVNAQLGINWTAATKDADWTDRMEHASVVFDGNMWVIGGTIGEGPPTIPPLLNDVWNSSDGANWTKLGNACFSGRKRQSAVIYNNHIFFILI